jgi:hypothetical protein
MLLTILYFEIVPKKVVQKPETVKTILQFFFQISDYCSSKKGESSSSDCEFSIPELESSFVVCGEDIGTIFWQVPKNPFGEAPTTSRGFQT